MKVSSDMRTAGVLTSSDKVSSQNIVTLEIGADDYLANSLHGEFVDAVAHDFEEISTILLGWHTKAIKSIECQSSALEVTEPYSNSDIAELSMTPLVTKNPEMEGEMHVSVVVVLCV